MIILLSNDDGYRAEGINILSRSLKKIARVIMFAPKENHSGSSSSLSLRKNLEVIKVSDDVFVVDGTPADTVYLGLSGILDVVPDIVISGINHGANLGEDVLYSGTVAAAIEGRVLDMPSIAVSSLGKNTSDYKVASKVTVDIVKRINQSNLPSDTILNVNVPAKKFEELNGYKGTRLGNRQRSIPLKKQTINDNRSLYQLGLPGIANDAGPGTDFHAVSNHSISVTPIHIDMTFSSVLNDTKTWLSK